MACDNASIAENAINAGAVMGNVGTFSGSISGNNIGSSNASPKKGGMVSERK